MLDIDKLLIGYAPGEPRMKPDVLLQIKEIELEREKMMQQQQQQQQIMLERPGQSPVALSMPEIVDLIKQQQSQLVQLNSRVLELETIVKTSQLQLLDKTQKIGQLQTSIKQFVDAEHKLNEIQLNEPIVPTIIQPIKPSLSQTWVVVEKSKTDPEIIDNCSENKDKK